METSRVRASVTLENWCDLQAVKCGLACPSDVRRITVDEVVIDPRSIAVALSPEVVRRLGLTKSLGLNTFGDATLDPVRLTVQGRGCTMGVWAANDNVPVRFGRIPLLNLDLVVDPQDQTLVGNPALDGEQVYESF